jgi:hypothetical protein
MDLEETEARNNCAGEDQHQFNWPTELGRPVPGGYEYGDLALQVGEVSNLRQQNIVMSPEGLGCKNDCTGEGQQQS